MESTVYGYVAALVSCLAFGSFAVPIKGEIANRVHIDPLAMQTYKTVMCFITCWIVLLLGQRFTFTPWGLLSGLFWVPGGTAGIYAVRTAGLAVSQGTWSTIKIMVAFVWGIFIFKEPVRSQWHASIAVILMMVGLWGMSYFSSISQRLVIANEDLTQPLLSEEDGTTFDEPLSSDVVEEAPTIVSSSCETQTDINQQTSAKEDGNANILNGEDRSGVDEVALEHETLAIDWGCIRLRKRQLGLLCAVTDGVWGGSILVPMHFARPHVEGLGFVISFAFGATIVLILMWLIRLGYYFTNTWSLKQAVQQLPSLHLKCMWLPGCVAGTLWSIGNMSSILTVSYLGEGVGYSIVQAQMLVAGLWGVLWYHEVRGWRDITGWFLFACVTVSGIVLLSHEHVK